MELSALTSSRSRGMRDQARTAAATLQPSTRCRRGPAVGAPGAPDAMRCPSCGHENRPSARFCEACGQPLAGRSGGDRRSYTPPHLAEKILASRSRLEGERRQVTVLFADVKGSMELAEQVDPEAWHHILDRFFAILAEGVHRFEGTINQFTATASWRSSAPRSRTRTT